MKVYLVKYGYYEFGGTFSSPWTVKVDKAFLNKEKAEKYIDAGNEELKTSEFSRDSKYYIEEIEVEE